MKICSFGKKHGPLDDTMYRIMDASKLFNPHNHPELRHLNGLDLKVQAFVEKDPNIHRLVGEAFRLIKQGQPIAFQCVGGQHRSVTCAELLARMLRIEGHEVEVNHRDINR